MPVKVKYRGIYKMLRSVLDRLEKQSKLDNSKQNKSLEITKQKIKDYKIKIKNNPDNDYFKLKLKILKLIKKYLERL